MNTVKNVVISCVGVTNYGAEYDIFNTHRKVGINKENYYGVYCEILVYTVNIIKHDMPNQKFYGSI